MATGAVTTHSPNAARRLWAPRAWMPVAGQPGRGAWQSDVLLEVARDGTWQAVHAGAPCPDNAQRLSKPVMPGMVNAHSHAFQRAFVGLAERRATGSDDFWSWRDRMYGVALTITPERLLTVATGLYREMLQGGYTHVCEFHYLHHDLDGRPYAEPATMALALVEAACIAGIGLTLLPVVYERAGFDAPALRADQRRFAAQVPFALRVRDDVRRAAAANVLAGVALHSLRAVAPESVALLQSLTAGDTGPIHVHVAEQTGEVEACVAATGLRPVEWLSRHVALDARWQLVHATHTTPDEIAAVAATRAGIVLCPTTEANLGDGLPDLPGWLNAGVPLAIGSDAQMARSWSEELRWLEYGQRLMLRRRNVAASPESGYPSTAACLVDRSLAGGASAGGFTAWGLQCGARADLLVIDTDNDALHGVDPEYLLDALVFASPARPFAGTMVAGRWVFEAS